MKIPVIIKIIAFYFAVLFIILACCRCSKYDLKIILPAHYCQYISCPFSQGEPAFVEGCGECYYTEPCWKLDSIHFYHPRLDYEGCDSIFSSLK